MSRPLSQPRPLVRPRARAHPFTVSEVLHQVRDCLDDHFRPLLVKGEVRDLRRPRSGHLYLTLHDRASQLKVVVFSRVLAELPHQVADGDELLVWGRIGAYPAAGEVQLVADHLEPAGLGALWALRERLRRRLEAEGLFAPARKRPLPPVPRAVGVVTSPSGAAIRDVLTTIERRFPGMAVVIAPAQVHGAAAASSLAAALTRLDRAARVDVILLVRGGGSREDLAAFDAEPVVRAAVACRVPVVTGVGHETDVTLVDLVADRRAPTPTGAAELAVPVAAELARALELRETRLRRALAARLDRLRRRLELAARAHGMRAVPLRAAALRHQLDAAERRLTLAHPRARLARSGERLLDAQRRLALVHPGARVSAERARLDQLERRLSRALAQRLAAAKRDLAAGAGRLASLSPLEVLARGYSLTTDEEGAVVKHAAALQPGDVVRTRLAEGAFTARVESIEQESGA